MIRVSMDLKSAVSSGRDRHLGTIIIANDGRPTSDKLHNYNIEVLNRRGTSFRQGRIENWDREGNSPMQLLKVALEAVGY